MVEGVGQGEEGLYLFDYGITKGELTPELTPDLDTAKREDLQTLISQFPSVFDSKPGRTIVSEHSVFVGDTAPIHQSPYRIPYSRRETVKGELDKMLAENIIWPSTSPWASPIVLVPKKDGKV